MMKVCRCRGRVSAERLTTSIEMCSALSRGMLGSASAACMQEVTATAGWDSWPGMTPIGDVESVEVSKCHLLGTLVASS